MPFIWPCTLFSSQSAHSLIRSHSGVYFFFRSIKWRLTKPPNHLFQIGSVYWRILLTRNMGKKVCKVRRSRRQRRYKPSQNIVGMGTPRPQKTQKKRKRTPADENGKHLSNQNHLKKQLAGWFMYVCLSICLYV